MKSNIGHGVIRIAVLILLWILAFPIGTVYLDTVSPYRSSGVIDVFFIFFLMICFSLLWTIGLGVEAFILNKKGKKEKRNFNFIIGSIVFLFSMFIWVMFYL